MGNKGTKGKDRYKEKNKVDNKSALIKISNFMLLDRKIVHKDNIEIKYKDEKWVFVGAPANDFIQIGDLRLRYTIFTNCLYCGRHGCNCRDQDAKFIIRVLITPESDNNGMLYLVTRKNHRNNNIYGISITEKASLREAYTRHAGILDLLGLCWVYEYSLETTKMLDHYQLSELNDSEIIYRISSSEIIIKREDKPDTLILYEYDFGELRKRLLEITKR